MIVVMGIFAADLTFLTPRLPAWTETVLGSGFRIGPGGKGSNQAIAIARLGAPVQFLAKIGRDEFGAMARGIYETEGVGTNFLFESTDAPTGAAAPGTTMMAFSPALSSMRMAAAPVGASVLSNRKLVPTPSVS
jgi:sugar/nucleoside kinase (ribokinase family)